MYREVVSREDSGVVEGIGVVELVAVVLCDEAESTEVSLLVIHSLHVDVDASLWCL